MAGYLCVAENKVGTVEKLFSLTVRGKKSVSVRLSLPDSLFHNTTFILSSSTPDDNWPERGGG